MGGRALKRQAEELGPSQASGREGRRSVHSERPAETSPGKGSRPRAAVPGDRRREAPRSPSDSEACGGGSAVTVKWGEVGEVRAHSPLKWGVRSAGPQPPQVPGEAGTAASSAARGNLPWVQVWRFPN